MQMYVIGKIGYEYNDEVYHRPYGCENASEPVSVYRSRENAEAECRRQNAAEFAKMDDEWNGLGSFGYDSDEIFDDEDAAVALLRKYGAIDEDEYPDSDELNDLFPTLFKDYELSEEDLTLAFSACKVTFFDVYEVHVGDE